jgi:hypothetical protein
VLQVSVLRKRLQGTYLNVWASNESLLPPPKAEILGRRASEILGRETRILDLKREVNELLGQAGKPPRYPSAESQDEKEK